jgi:nucleoside-diphosphate-sugar epimerase
MDHGSPKASRRVGKEGLLAGHPVPTTRGDQVRDFMHVEDAAAALVVLADGVTTGAVNVASGSRSSARRG